MSGANEDDPPKRRRVSTLRVPTAGGEERVGAKSRRGALTPTDALGSLLPEPSPPDPASRIRKAVRDLSRSGPESHGPLRRRVLAVGADALPVLEEAFPGILWVDLSRPHRPLRSASQVSGVACALAESGPEAVPFVARLLVSERPEVRLCAILVATDLAQPALVDALVERFDDEIIAVRQAAMEALRASPATLALMRPALLARLGDGSHDPTLRERAAWTLGELRDARAVTELIALVGDPLVAESVRGALALLTGRDLGRLRLRWWWWYRRKGSRGRLRWLCDALDQPDPDMRRWVAEELFYLVGEEFAPTGDAQTRRAARALAREYRAWLAVR